ncbi:MAG: cytochrome c [Pyrinomonadaceae bacterium]
MYYLKLAIFILFIGLAVLACSEGRANRKSFVIAESDSYEASLFRQNCAICHGPEADGKEVDGKMIPSLRYGDAATKTREEIYHQIKYGKLPMPAFGRQLTEAEINKMVHFVRHDLQGKDDSPGEK